MVSQKRKRTEAVASDAEFSEVSLDLDDAHSDDDIDISTALTGKRPKVSRGPRSSGKDDFEEDDDDIDTNTISENFKRLSLYQSRPIHYGEAAASPYLSIFLNPD